jgi:hypothetical protein
MQLELVVEATLVAVEVGIRMVQVVKVQVVEVDLRTLVGWYHIVAR